MTEPRHLRPVPPSPSPSSSSDRLLDEDAARAVHRKVADQLRELSDVGLIQRARQVAQDFKSPTPHQHLAASEWACMAGSKLGDVQRQVFDLSVIGTPRQVRMARTEIERAVGLLLVLDDVLCELEDGQAS